MYYVNHKAGHIIRKKGAISDLILDEILRPYIILNFERLPNLYIGFNTQD
jgi:hypothetical protein